MILLVAACALFVAGHTVKIVKFALREVPYLIGDPL
jgi:uncharacterized membrane protein